MSPTPPAGSLFRRAPIPLTEMMYRFRAPELSAQFMMAPLCDPCQLPSLPQICGVWLEVVLAQSDCRTVGRTYTGRPRVILSLPPGAPRLRKHHCQPNGSPPILLVFWALPGPSLLVVQLQASRCFDSCATGVSRSLVMCRTIFAHPGQNFGMVPLRSSSPPRKARIGAQLVQAGKIEVALTRSWPF